MEIVADIAAGLGLFFIGVRLIGGNLRELSGRWFRRLIARATGNPLLAAVVGTLSGAITLSSSAITFIVVSMITSGLLGARRAVPLVVWANVGTSVLVLLAVVDLRLLVLYLLGATGVGYFLDLDRAPRWRHGLGSALGVALLFLGIVLMKEGGQQLLYLALQVASALAMSLLGGPVLALAARAAPESEEERLSRPRFLYDQAVEDPETAVDLVRREQARVFAHLPELLDRARPAAEAGPLLEACRSLVRRCEMFLTELLDATTSRDLMLAVLGLEKRNQLLGELVTTVDQQLAGPYARLDTGAESGADDRLGSLLAALVESQHALLLTAAEALGHEGPEEGPEATDDDIAVLLALSGDRSEAMDRLRRRVAGETRLTAAQHDRLYAATALFERTVWLVRRYALLLGREAAPG